MSQIAPDTKTGSLKRKVLPVEKTDQGETASVVHSEDNGKRCKLDESSQKGFALHCLELKPENDEGKVMSSLVEKIISNLSINRDSKIAEFNHGEPILLTIPMIVKTENGVERKHYFYNSKPLK